MVLSDLSMYTYMYTTRKRLIFFRLSVFRLMPSSLSIIWLLRMNSVLKKYCSFKFHAMCF